MLLSEKERIENSFEENEGVITITAFIIFAIYTLVFAVTGNINTWEDVLVHCCIICIPLFFYNSLRLIYGLEKSKSIAG